MSTDQDYREIVWVKDHCRLVDAESYERTYWCDQGRGLPQGYYIVDWPRDARDRRAFDERAVFIGPFPHRRAASLALEGQCAA